MAPPRTQWATYVFFNFLNPLLYTHHRYYRLKVQVDRILEKKGFFFNVGIGLVFGSTAYLLATPLMPMYVNKTSEESEQDCKDLLTILKLEGRKELGSTLIYEARTEIINRLYSVVDKIQVRQQRLAMEKEKELIEALKREKAAKAAAASAPAAGQ